MGTQYQVLICDDDQAFGEMLSEYLRIACSCKVTLVSSEEELWLILPNRSFDILFLDYQLPYTNGLEILKKISLKAIDIPTVMMTGQGSEQIAARAIQNGALEYLVKGEYSFSALQNLIDRAVQMSQLKRLMRESAKKIQYQATVLNGVRDAVVAWSMSGEVTYWNRAAENLYRMKADQMIGRSIYEVYIPLFQPQYQFPLNFEQGIYQSERWFQVEGRDQVWVSSQISVMTDGEDRGQSLGFMDVTRDITGRKLMEDQIQAAQTRLAQANRLASIGQLASSVAHQISNPLTTIIADGQLLVREFKNNKDVFDSARAIVDAGWRAQQVVDELLKFSVSSEEVYGTVQIRETIDKALLLASSHVEASGTNLVTQLPDQELIVYGSRRQIIDLWVNLLLTIVSQSNGLAEKTILVKGRQEEGLVNVEFSHQGVSISAEEAQAIFEPQLVPTSAKWGTGMELTICREIVRQHKGEISFRVETNSVNYTILLPQREDRGL